MKDSDSVDELYAWINSRYEEYTNDEISEEKYLEDLEFYKRRIGELEVQKVETKNQVSSSEEVETPKRVRSTSIAGLRKKMMEEMNK